ncbi:unnamed protein product [Chilo suppressalis]|uniref:Zasp-like motif domain-containing protein n=1 Tax=Chilo suppressalis TaxID=168631 RepID=A0ABN8B357_CHISP|nr:unnamed protein product [Chilo suppressalis]
MATKSYSKHKEFKEYSSSGSANVPYTDEQFDMLKSELIPKGSKLETLGNGVGAREYHYEYKEEKHPSGKYDRKDLHTVEQYSIPPKKVPKASESSSYYYEREERELPSITSGVRTYNYETSNTSTTPGNSKIKSSKVTKDLSQNVEELDSLLDDLQKDQERQLYKSGYTSDTAESTSFDYKRGTAVKAPSSGYSTLRREERVESSSWSPPAPLHHHDTTGSSSKKREERLESSSWSSSPVPARSTELRQEMFREETTESRVVPVPVPAPVVVPAPVCTHCHQHPVGTLPRSGTPMNKVTTTVKTYTYEVPAGQDPATLPLPIHADHQHTYVANETIHSTNTSNTLKAAPPPPLGCQYCSHCKSRVEDERVVYTTPANHSTHLTPLSPPGPTSYKYSETSYSAHNTTQRYPGSSPSPVPGAFPRPTTPSPGNQQPPKKLDDLLADFPEARFPTQPDGVYRRKVEVTHEKSRDLSRDTRDAGTKPVTPVGSNNVAGPAVYYPPGHTPFAKKPETQVQGYQASSAMQQGGGAHASGRGMYEYESGSRSKEKHSERKTAVPVCLPLCCAMPCVIM